MPGRWTIPSTYQPIVETPFVRVPFQELTARLQSRRVRPAHVGARERLASDGKSRRQIRIAARVARADHELSAVALRANRRVDAFAPDGKADIVRTADAGFDEQLRHAGGEHRAVFEPVVRDAEISVVANQRRPQESRVAVIAAAVDAERHAESSGAHAEHRAARAEISLRVDFHQPHASAVRDTPRRIHRCPSDRRPRGGRRQPARRRPTDRPTPLRQRTRCRPVPRRTASTATPRRECLHLNSRSSHRPPQRWFPARAPVPRRA